MTQQINIQIPQQNLQVPLPALLSLLSNAPVPSANTPELPAEFGAELQGGIYAGPIWENGKLEHLIAAPETLGEHDWDDAGEVASKYRGGGFEDWFLPTKPHLMIAQIYVRDAFEQGYHWTSTPGGEYYAWGVDFEHGHVLINHRSHEFRVRPFRRLSI